jgi:hypothetical protein
MEKLRGKLTYANVTSTMCLFLLLGGGAFAASQLPKNSVGGKQLKKNAVTGPKVAAHSLTGEDLNLSTLGTVPNATTAASASTADTAKTTTNSNHANTADLAQDAETVNGFEVGCFANTVMIGGACFDSTLSGPVNGVEAASNACATKGGFLPGPMLLYSVKGVINLGTGVPPNFAVADEYFWDGSKYQTVVVDGKGTISAVAFNSETKYICAYLPVG